ncbi:DNA repair protein, putative [Babesia bigemina]|uniref:DNA repair protein, putative n=1 Tax=Babesia bigemina TaxID=5866 RepID=A0A061DCD7_BABBI|nr:DNA repair protein, putative [Babesia bigemina]CDR97737.1 DNA repair protein, putative [Babesia bigemina]|eukprot:XP_012769923.1 DNA repair protein, putative [Babesia bigemina]
MQLGIKAYFATRPRTVSIGSNDTPSSDAQSGVAKDVVAPAAADNPSADPEVGKVVDVAKVPSLSPSLRNSDPLKDEDALKRTYTCESVAPAEPRPDSIDTCRVSTSDASQQDAFDDGDESPICRKRSLMFDNGFVPEKLKCTEITDEFIGAHLDVIEHFIAQSDTAGSYTAGTQGVLAGGDASPETPKDCPTTTVSPNERTSSLSPADSAVAGVGTLGSLRASGTRPPDVDDEPGQGRRKQARKGGRASSGKDEGAATKRVATQYVGHDGDVEELTFVDRREVEGGSAVATAGKLTVGSEKFTACSQSVDCVTDEERKLYLTCPASQKSRCFKAYVEHYYRYNETFVFPPWVQIREIRDRNGLRPTDESYDPSTLWVPSRSHRWAVAFRSCHFTECMQQWWYVKQDRFDQLLFFKMGRFYELFYHDACIVQEICGLRWMGSEAKPHVGFPEKSLHIYASACVARGYKVVVVEQTETPQQLEQRNRETGQRQNTVSRAICEIITPGTITRPDMLGTQSKQLLLIAEAVVPPAATAPVAAEAPTAHVGGTGDLAQPSTPTARAKTNPSFSNPSTLSSGRRNSRFGSRRRQTNEIKDLPGERLLCICSMDASMGTIALGMVDISLGLGELRALVASVNPAEVVVDAATIGSLNELYGMTVYMGFELTSFNCAHQFTPENVGNSDVKIAEVDYGAFEERAKAALGSSNAAYERLMLLLQRYLRSVMLDNLLNYCAVKTLGADNYQYMTLDGAALTQLELFKSQEGDNSACLFGFLNKTCCPFGERMLRRWVLKPLMSAKRINARSRTVEFLSRNFSICSTYQEQLSLLPDLERSFGKVLNAAAGCYKMAVYFDEGVFTKIYDLHLLLANFDRLQQHVSAFFSEAAEYGAECPSLLREMSSSVAKVTGHCGELNARLNVTGLKTCSSRPGVWKESDEVRSRIDATKSRLDALLVEIQKTCPSACFVHTKFRYEVELNERDHRRLSQSGKSLEITSTKAGHVRVRTSRIVSLVNELEEHEFALTQSELTFFQDAVRLLHDRRGVFSELLVTAAELDCLCSLASVAKHAVIPLVRPEVFERGSAEPYMYLRASAHPVVSQLTPDSFVPNDIHLNHGDYGNLLLITGPNMGGKSTLLRQTALCAIMAQIGSFVPASECRMTAVDRIYTRLGASDNLMQGKSTFLVEMEEVSSILHTGTKDSLVLVDELGRGTSTFDATAIAAACLEKIDSIGCRCLFTTHFQEVCAYALRLPRVTLCHMTAAFDDEARTLTFLYKLAQGQCPESHGIHVARLAGIPPNVLEMAEKVSRRFRAQKRSPAATLGALLGAHSRGDEAVLRALYEELRQPDGR